MARIEPAVIWSRGKHTVTEVPNNVRYRRGGAPLQAENTTQFLVNPGLNYFQATKKNDGEKLATFRNAFFLVLSKLCAHVK